MGKVTHISTPNEIKIASRLSAKRAKVFLESRCYIRNALSSLFNIKPLEIHLKANPGKPPILPRGMGNISISHCENAFIICWYHKKIGIDIERSNRNFNYQSLSEKYFNQKNIHKSNLNRYEVLKRWCATEAAIKWDRGSLSKDLKVWKYEKFENQIYNTNKKLKINLDQFAFEEWTISIAYKNEKLINHSKIICCDL
mgnify:CR=1 FL=1|tara:strand:+ start:212 stop:805 length:594 start_codon:yes stop_codon:yes gene_type:complete